MRADRRPRHVDDPEITYELLWRAHGRGYATEGAFAVLDAAIAIGRTRLWPTVRTWKVPSFRALEKLGFGRDQIRRMTAVSWWLTRDLPVSR